MDEGITACQWRPLSEALEILSYDNARGVLKRAGEMVRTLVAVGSGRGGRAGGRAEAERNENTRSYLGRQSEGCPTDRLTASPPVRPFTRPPDMPAIAALLENRAALVALRRTLPKGGPTVVSCRTSARLHRLLDRRLVDAVVLGPQPNLMPELTELRVRLPHMPLVV